MLMFEDNTTLTLNVVIVVITAVFFGYVLLLAPGPEPVASEDVVPVVLTMPAPTEVTSPPAEVPAVATATPPATPTRTVAPTSTPTPTPTQILTSTPTAETPTATITPEPAVRHTVAAGEVLSAIAAQYGVTVDAIMEANELADPNRLEVGQVLIIPVPATSGPP